MKPVFQVNGHDYTQYLSEEGLKPSLNDIDADGSGRNLLDALMYRNRMATKYKWTVSFLRLTETVQAQLLTDMYATQNYVTVKMLDPKTNQYASKSYYCSTISPGVQRYIGGQTVYDGTTFNLTER